MKYKELRKEIQNTRSELARMRKETSTKAAELINSGKYSKEYLAEKIAKINQPYNEAVSKAKTKLEAQLRETESRASENIKAFYMTMPSKETIDLIEIMKQRASKIQPGNDAYNISKTEMDLFYEQIKGNYNAQLLAEEIFRANARSIDDNLILPPNADEISRMITKATSQAQAAINSLDKDAKEVSYNVADYYIGSDEAGANAYTINLADSIYTEVSPTETTEPTEPTNETPKPSQEARLLSLGALINQGIDEASAHGEVFKSAKLRLLREKYHDALTLDASEAPAALAEMKNISDSAY